jgi:hypothetical protein
VKDEVQPLDGMDEDASRCPFCGGGGLRPSETGPKLCVRCGGCGYGPSLYALDRERRHCIERLSRWAHRAPCTEEN